MLSVPTCPGANDCFKAPLFPHRARVISIASAAASCVERELVVFSPNPKGALCCASKSDGAETEALFCREEEGPSLTVPRSAAVLLVTSSGHSSFRKKQKEADRHLCLSFG